MDGVPIYNSIDQIMTVFDLLGRAKRIVIPKSMVGKVNSYKSMCAYLHVCQSSNVHGKRKPTYLLNGSFLEQFPKIAIKPNTRISERKISCESDSTMTRNSFNII